MAVSFIFTVKVKPLSIHKISPGMQWHKRNLICSTTSLPTVSHDHEQSYQVLKVLPWNNNDIFSYFFNLHGIIQFLTIQGLEGLLQGGGVPISKKEVEISRGLSKMRKNIIFTYLSNSENVCPPPAWLKIE